MNISKVFDVFRPEFYWCLVFTYDLINKLAQPGADFVKQAQNHT